MNDRKPHNKFADTTLLDASSSCMMTITDKEFSNIRTLVYDNFGINLTEQKRSLVVGRLQKVLRKMGMATFAEYYQYVLSNPKALSEMVNLISTNHTFFYRENEHFEFMREVALPQIRDEHLKRNNRDVRVWCAAASSGEEPYTLMITLLEFFGRDYSNWDVGLLATDISQKALDKALEGIYPDERVNLVPDQTKNKYFTKVPQGWKVKDTLKKEITYRRFNLMNEQLPFKKQFDMIFCRNVMIYFDQPTRKSLVERLYNVTVPGGYLFIGHSETLGREGTSWKYVKPAVYRKEC